MRSRMDAGRSGSWQRDSPRSQPARPWWEARARSPGRHGPTTAAGPDSAKYITLTQITKDNVKRASARLDYPTHDNVGYRFGPIVVDNVAYVLARNNSLVALDATTGKEIWIHEDLQGMAPRGINYWESRDRRDRRLLFQTQQLPQAIDAKTGKSILTFGTNGAVDLREGLRPRPGDASVAGPVAESRQGLREPDHPRLGARRGLPVAARRPPRVRRRHRQARVAVPHRAASRRVRLRDVAEGRVEIRRRREHVGRDLGRRRSAASPTSRPARRPTTTTAPIASARICSARRSSRSTRAPASGSGISRSSTTISGTTTTPPRRS